MNKKIDTKKYTFKSYSKKYLSIFETEKRLLSSICEQSKTVSDFFIEHIGSTSVKDLGGKGIVDLVFGITLWSEVEIFKQILTQKGDWEFRESASYQNRLFFRKDILWEEEIQRMHLHLVKYKSRDWQEMIRFRNQLKNNKRLRDEYVKIKKKAVAIAQGDGKKYRDLKECFINKISNK